MCGNYIFNSQARERSEEIADVVSPAVARYSVKRHTDHLSSTPVADSNNQPGGYNTAEASVRACDHDPVPSEPRLSSSSLMRANEQLCDPAPEDVIVPTKSAPVLSLSTQGLYLAPKLFGYPPSTPGRKSHYLYNARSESVLDRAVFQNGIRHQRAVIPAAAFREFDSERNMFTFARPDHAVLFLAGFFDRKIVTFQDGRLLPSGFAPDPADRRTVDEQKKSLGIEERLLPCFIILTTHARGVCDEVHERMPVILEEDEIRPWLTGSNVTQVLTRRDHTRLEIV